MLWCEMCHARVRRPQMGKHLLSHYHCRVAGTNPCSSPAASRFILENMGNVVRQCPFQCASCRFYCNTQETFMLHWRSNLHTKKFGDVNTSRFKKKKIILGIKNTKIFFFYHRLLEITSAQHAIFRVTIMKRWRTTYWVPITKKSWRCLTALCQ